MKQVLNPGITTNTVSLIDHIVYSRVEDLQGNPLELDLSIMAAMGNSEMQAAMGWKRPAEILPKKPCLVWFNGGGWRGVDKNGQLGELARFAKEGYVVACVYYRSSARVIALPRSSTARPQSGSSGPIVSSTASIPTALWLWAAAQAVIFP